MKHDVRYFPKQFRGSKQRWLKSLSLPVAALLTVGICGAVFGAVVLLSKLAA